MGDTGQMEKKALPQRSTRGKRMQAQLAEEEEQADAEFWNQEFFAEDVADADYVSEKEEEDVPDSDFFKSESEEDEEEVQVCKEPKKKALKAPGAPPARPKAAKPPKPTVIKTEAGSPSALGVQQAAAAAAGGEVSQQLLFEVTYEAPTLRKSTRERMEVAQKEREERDQIAKAARRPTQKSECRVLTQEELLAEAARTELENLASLKLLLAQEEETKRKANVKKQRYGGPMVKQRSRGVEVLLRPAPISFELQLTAAGTSAAAGAAAVVVPNVLGTPGIVEAGMSVLSSAVLPMDVDTAELQQGTPAAAAASDAATRVLTAAAMGAAAAAVADSGAVPLASTYEERAGAATPITANMVGQGAADAAATALSSVAAAAAQPITGDAAPAQPSAAAAAAVLLEPEQQQQRQSIGPTLVKQEITTLQCFGMKAPKWLQPQCVQPPPAKPLCAITGLVAKYKDPLTGHYYASAEAFRELRRRLGQPLPDAHKRRKSADAVAAAAAAAGGSIEMQQVGTSAAAEVGRYPPGKPQLLSLLQQHVQHQRTLVVSGKGRGGKTAYQPQPMVLDEVAALVLNVSQLVHGAR